MTEITDAEVGEIDLAVVAYRDEGDWNVAELPDRSLDTVDDHRQGAAALPRRERRAGADLGGRGLRAAGARPGLAWSGCCSPTSPPPPTGAWPARPSTTSACTSTTRTTRRRPATSAIVADMGMSAQDMGALLDDYDLYPEEILSDVADNVGFGTKFDELVGLDG